jgi:hypothetical protein
MLSGNSFTFLLRNPLSSHKCLGSPSFSWLKFRLHNTDNDYPFVKLGMINMKSNLNLILIPFNFLSSAIKYGYPANVFDGKNVSITQNSFLKFGDSSEYNYVHQRMLGWLHCCGERNKTVNEDIRTLENWIHFCKRKQLFRLQWVRFEVLTMASMKMDVFWLATPCSLVDVYRCCRGACCLHHQVQTSTRLHGVTTKTAIFKIAVVYFITFYGLLKQASSSFCSLHIS